MTADSNALCGMTLRGVRVTIYRLMTSAGIIFLATNVMKCFLNYQEYSTKGYEDVFQKRRSRPTRNKENTLARPQLENAKHPSSTFGHVRS